MKVAMVVGGYAASHARLQPWRYLGELAAGLAARGHDVVVYTDVAPADAVALPAVRVVPSWSVPHLGCRGRRPTAARGESQVVLWHVGRLAPLYPPRPRRGDRDIAVLTAPLYNGPELRAMLRSSGRRAREAAIHFAGGAIPLPLFARALASRYERVVTLADYAAERLVAAGLPADRVQAIPPGCDAVSAEPGSTDTATAPITFTYAGNASYLRGADLLVRAFAEAFAERPDVRLRLAVRHEDDHLSPDGSRLDAVIAATGLGNRVESSGNLTRDELLELFHDSSAVVLPFRAVPSEAPLMPLEVASVGGRLIVSDLPPLRGVCRAGTRFVRPGSVASLRRALADAASADGGAIAAGTPSVAGDAAAPAARRWTEVIDELESFALAPAGSPGRTSQPLGGDRSRALRAARPHVIYLCGNDGTGKTTQADLIVDALRARGIPARYVWLRFPQLVSIPVLLASRGLGITRYATIDGRRTGRWEFHRAPWLARLLLWTQVVDAAVFRLLKVDLPAALGTTIVLDRFALDIIVDIAAAARDAHLAESLPARLLASLTRGWLVLVLEANADALRTRRPDLAHDPLLGPRADLYLRLADRHRKARRIDALQSIETIHEQILERALGATR